MRLITWYISRGRRFAICEVQGRGAEDGYWAFEDTDIDEDGKLRRQVNGIQGHHSPTIRETVERVSQQIRVDEMVAGGMDRMEAAIAVVTGKA